MGKAILELEMPESCWDCPLQAISTEKKIRYCTVIRYVTEYYGTKRSENCPLKPVKDDVEALSDTPADYHNPADVELLRKARKALHKGISELKVHCKYFDQTPEEDACIEMHETALEIDKVLGENG